MPDDQAPRIPDRAEIERLRGGFEHGGCNYLGGVTLVESCHKCGHVRSLNTTTLRLLDLAEYVTREDVQEVIRLAVNDSIESEKFLLEQASDRGPGWADEAAVVEHDLVFQPAPTEEDEDDG